MEEAAEEVKGKLENLALNDDQAVLLAVTVAVAVVSTLVFAKCLCGGGRGKKKVKKGADGKGPTGKGKAKIYHSKILRSSRVTWLIEGWCFCCISLKTRKSEGKFYQALSLKPTPKSQIVENIEKVLCKLFEY